MIESGIAGFEVSGWYDAGEVGTLIETNRTVLENMRETITLLQKYYARPSFVALHELLAVPAPGAIPLSSGYLSLDLQPLTLVGAALLMQVPTTFQEFRGVFEKDRALARRFQKIDVNEPTIEDTIKIIAGLRSSFEQHHNVRYTPDAIKSAVELSARYIHDRKLPDKAIDVIDEVGAMQMLVPPSRRKKVITTKEIEAVVATMARIPPKSVSADDKNTLQHLDADLKRVVFGQDPAIDALASAINEDRHVPMLEAAIRWTARALDANEVLIRDMVRKKANWVLKLAGLDAKTLGVLCAQVERLAAFAGKRHALLCRLLAFGVVLGSAVSPASQTAGRRRGMVAAPGAAGLCSRYAWLDPGSCACSPWLVPITCH